MFVFHSQDAVFQRTHLTTHLISEYTFTQTTGSSSSSSPSPPSIDNDNGIHGETANEHQQNPTAVYSNDASIQADNVANDEEILSVSKGADNVRERAAYGSTDVV